MKDKHLLYLKIAYVWALSLMFLSLIVDLYASARAILLLLAFIPVAAVHIIVSLNILMVRVKIIKTFLFISIVWCIKVIVFAISEGLYFFFQAGVALLDWIDLFLLIAIALLTSLSFLLRTPFFYTKEGGKIVVFIGAIGLLLSLWSAIMLGLSLADMYVMQ